MSKAQASSIESIEEKITALGGTEEYQQGMLEVARGYAHLMMDNMGYRPDTKAYSEDYPFALDHWIGVLVATTGPDALTD